MSDIQFVALDVETTLNGNEDIGLAHPMSPDNRVVLYGVGIGSKETITEESSILGFPAVTIRQVHERPCGRRQREASHMGQGNPEEV